jgi:predicted TIM-barrel fold metal-dependent hydrolase
MTPSAAIDIHQHLWPPAFVDALRSRSQPPRLTGWTLLLDGEPPFPVNAADHVPAARRALDGGRIVLGLSSPLGIENLSTDEGAGLLDAWHDGAVALRPEFDAWAAVSRQEPDLDGLRTRLADGFVGLQIPATWLSTPRDVDVLAPVLEAVAAAERPLFVHPGPVPHPSAGASAGTDGADSRPTWWPALVDYPAQLTASWWSWYVAGRAAFPDLRICFAAGAGLAPVHHERFLARSGRPLVVNRSTFVDTSSYARQGIDSLIRVLGIDLLVLGSDRPYATPLDVDLGDAALTAIRHTNPLALLEGPTS